ncbi:MAG: hypothetical protein J6R04_00975, partial [Clostridia bacterium]|nr:hypothetical protein [Clostridia bacterium]
GYENGPYLIKTVYATEQTVIADIIVTPEAYGVDPTGENDSTKGIQKALDDCRTMGGGTVFLPVGQYLVTDTLSLAEGVLLQGDWQDPDLTDTPAYGTVILAKLPALKGEEVFDPTAKPLFLLRSENASNNGLVGLTVFYPDQDITNVKPYGYTVYAPNPGMTVLKDLTFLNSYQGIGVCLGAGYHELLQIQGVHMTALATGYQVKQSNEVGYTYDLNVSPSYWIEAAAPYRCADANALRAFCREYTTAMKFGSLDLNQYTGIRIDGCYTAMLIDTGFWGVLYDVEITDSVYGIVARALTGASGVGIAHASIEADEYAVANYAVSGKPIKLTDVKLTGNGGIHTVDGAFTMVDNTADLSQYEAAYATYQKPSEHLYVADVAGVVGKREDATPAIQDALDAAEKTGGIVYVPRGVYNLYTPLVVPAGVELRGAMAMPARDRAYESGIIPGTVFLSYVTENALITLSEAAGVQGVRIYTLSYDAGTAIDLLKTNDPKVAECVAVRGIGAGVYAVNVVISGGFIGIDFTDCDNHLVKDAYGCAFLNFVRAGGKNGNINSVLCNMTFTMRQPFMLRGLVDADLCNEGAWAVYSVEGNATAKATVRDELLRQYCDTVYLVNAENEKLNNVFMYGGRAIVVADSSTVTGINVTTDWQGIYPMFVLKNESDGVFFNAVRTSGSSHELDKTSSLSVYNRLFNIYHNEPTYHSASGYEETRGGELLEELTLLNCDSVSGTQGVVLNTDATYIKQGKGSLKHDGKVPTQWLTATFDPVDTAELGDEQLYLHMWMWVDDPHGLQWSGQIELKTATGTYWNWGTTQNLTQEGWNEILLPIPRRGETAPVFTGLSIKVDHSPLNHYPNVYLDDISVCTVLPYSESMMQEANGAKSYVERDPSYTEDAKRVMINNCDTLDGLSEAAQAITTLNRDPAFIKEGKGSLKVSVRPQLLYEQSIPATDIGDMEHVGYLHMWVYVENASLFSSSGQIELTSSGIFDLGEKGWNIATIKQNGWNELYLPLKDATSKGTPAFNGSAVNYLRMYVNVPSAATIYIDDIYVCNIPGATYDESNTIEAGNAAQLAEGLPMLHNCDTEIGITKATLNEDPAYVKTGSGSLRAPDVGSDKLVFGLPEAQDISAYMDGYLHVSVYVEDASRLSWGQFELTSSGTCDKDEIGWLVPNYVKQDGWNEVYLPMEKASKLGAFDPKSCNFMRVYVLWDDGGNSPLMYFDDIRLVAKEDYTEGDAPAPSDPTPADPKPQEPEEPVYIAPLIILDGESIVDGLEKVTLDHSLVKEGSGSLRAPDQGQDKLLYIIPEPLDATDYMNGYLHISVYVEDASLLSWGQIELTSSGKYDEQELGWLVPNYIKEDGWNDLYLPISKASRGGEFDPKNCNYLRIYVICDSGTYPPMYFDDIYLTATKP